MSQKYAGLPDIDAFPDVYETLSPPASPILKDEEDLDEAHIRTARLQREREKEAEREARRAGGRLGLVEGQAGKAPAEDLEEIDWGTGVGVEEGWKRWRKRERRGAKKDITSTFELEETTLERFARLQLELAELEDHVSQQKSVKKRKATSDSHNGNIAGTATGNDAAEAENQGGMIRSLVELRERLGRLESGGVLEVEEEADEEDDEEQGGGEEQQHQTEEEQTHPKTNGDAHPLSPDTGVHRRTASTSSVPGSSSAVDMVALDRRLASLEVLLGSSSISSTAPHPAPLIPTVSRLSTQLNLLTQPRHLDGLGRRLKTLLSDLERYEGPAHQQGSTGAGAWGTGGSGRTRQPTGPLQEDRPPTQSTAHLLHLLNRLDPLLPTLPPLLLRLRSLSALHASAATFAGRLREAEEREKAMERALEELEAAVDGVERGVRENEVVVRANVAGLEERVNGVLARVEALEGEDGGKV